MAFYLVLMTLPVMEFGLYFLIRKTICTAFVYPLLITYITDVLAGYNGTIFAYGQTSSGKTHTMEVSST